MDGVHSVPRTSFGTSPAAARSSSPATLIAEAGSTKTPTSLAKSTRRWRFSLMAERRVSATLAYRLVAEA